MKPARWFFSDRHRLPKMLALGAGFVALCLYAYRTGPAVYPPYYEGVANPKAHAGKNFWLVPPNRVTAVNGKRVTVQHLKHRVEVVGNAPLNVAVGDYIYLRTRLSADGTLAVEDYRAEPHYAASRVYLWSVSLAILALLLVLLWREFRPQWRPRVRIVLRSQIGATAEQTEPSDG